MARSLEGLDHDSTEETDELGKEHQDIDGVRDVADETGENKEIGETGDCKEETESEEIENVKPDEVKEGLTEDEKEIIRKEKIFSDPRIINAIRSLEEYKIYKNARLIEKEIGGKICLIRTDIDWEAKIATVKHDINGNPLFETNYERMARGRAPYNSDGELIVLHHIGQHIDSPLAELTPEEHTGKVFDGILHNKNIKSETHGKGNKWDKERLNHWKSRAKLLRSENV